MQLKIGNSNEDVCKNLGFINGLTLVSSRDGKVAETASATTI